MIKKILIKTPNWLGDSVMSIPAVKGIKRLFPGAEIWVLSKAKLADLWKLAPAIDGIIIEGGRTSLKKRRFDMALLLTNSFGSALRMYRAGIPERRGYNRNLRGLLLTQPVALKDGWKKMHQIEYFLGLVDGLGSIDIDPAPEINISLEAQNKAKGVLAEYGWKEGESVIGIHATASYGPAKCWLPERFSELIKNLKEVYNSWIFLCGSREEEKNVENIILKLPDNNKVINLSGKTDILNLAAITSMCRIFISNDSGPMHLAGAVGVPVVAIFGSTDPVKTGPRGRGKAVVIKKDISCSPCFKRRCPKKLKCMNAVEVKDVMEAVKKIVSNY